MVDLYRLFTNPELQNKIFAQGFERDYRFVGPANNRISVRTENGEMPTIRSSKPERKSE